MLFAQTRLSTALLAGNDQLHELPCHYCQWTVQPKVNKTGREITYASIAVNP